VYRLVYILVLFIFAGCSLKTPYTSSKAYQVVIKNSTLALNDTGFIKRDDKRFNLQLFSAGSLILDLVIKKDVCLDYVCLNKEEFNRKFFGFRHYENFINDLFEFKPLYNKRNLKEFQNGFSQNLVSKNYDIFYEMKEGQLYFKDRKNRVLIKLKELK